MVFLSSRELSSEDEEVKMFIYLFIYLNWKVVDELLMFSQFFFS